MIVVEGKSFGQIQKEEQAQWEDVTVEEHMELYLKKGFSKKDAMKQVAKDRGVGKREIYQALIGQLV